MNKIIAISIVRNEKGRFLSEWLENVQFYADYHVVLDDCSDDGTYEELLDYEIKYQNKVRVFQAFKESVFKTNEAGLRNALWEKVRTIAKPEDWILVVDADEFYKAEDLKSLEVSEKFDVVSLRLCDMWNKTHYRTDGFWSPYFHRLFRFKDEQFTKELKEGLHHPSIPDYVLESQNVYQSEIKCIHCSYRTRKLRRQKYDFYLQNVEDDFNLEHARSIFEKPTLKPLDKDLPKILVASLVRNREWILPSFLKCLDKIDYPKYKIDYYFIINNSYDRSEELIREFAKTHPCHIEVIKFKDNLGRSDHTWDARLLKNMAKMRNSHLQKAQNIGAEYLISIDSDVLFPPPVVKHLVLSDREIISPVFWAGWNQQKVKLPQVWEKGGYDLSEAFMQMLLTRRGLFRVGGLGAFTAIHKSVWEKGVNYDRVYNLPDNISGEDRDFCLRATVHGFNLWASTYYDLIHVDNKEMYENLKKFHF